MGGGRLGPLFSETLWGPFESFVLCFCIVLNVNNELKYETKLIPLST